MNEILVAILTGSFALFGVIIAMWFDNRRGNLEHQRWYAEHFIDQKLNSLRELHVALVDCYFTLNHYGNCPPKTRVEYNEMNAPKEAIYLRKKVMASIYFNDNEDEVFAEMLGAFRQANMAIWLLLPDAELQVNKAAYSDHTRNLDWKRLTDKYKATINLLKMKLAPEMLGAVENVTIN